MAMKWLEERWETLIPAVDLLGKEQEEQMRLLCEAEKDWWRHRPGMNVVNSLRKPMTETRNHIREVLLLRDDNWWINPKSQAKEHLALKYLNFSTEEWTQMALPVDCGIAIERHRLCRRAESGLQESGTGFARERAILQESDGKAMANSEPFWVALNEITNASFLGWCLRSSGAYGESNVRIERGWKQGVRCGWSSYSHDISLERIV